MTDDSATPVLTITPEALATVIEVRAAEADPHSLMLWVEVTGEQNGAFTGMLKQVWNGGKFRGRYRRFRDTIVSRMPSSQTPNYFFVGAPNRAFEAQRPFKI